MDDLLGAEIFPFLACWEKQNENDALAAISSVKSVIENFCYKPYMSSGTVSCGATIQRWAPMDRN